MIYMIHDLALESFSLLIDSKAENVDFYSQHSKAQNVLFLSIGKLKMLLSTFERFTFKIFQDFKS